MPEKNSHLTSLINFAVHVLIGFTMFVIIGVPAALLNVFVDHLGHAGISGFVIKALVALEHFILIVDVLAVAVYTIISTYREIKGMLK